MKAMIARYAGFEHGYTFYGPYDDLDQAQTEAKRRGPQDEAIEIEVPGADDLDSPEGHWIALIGDPWEGLNAYGPFLTVQEVAEWLECNTSDPSWIYELQPS